MTPELSNGSVNARVNSSSTRNRKIYIQQLLQPRISFSNYFAIWKEFLCNLVGTE
jgi:hypothetical protein